MQSILLLIISLITAYVIYWSIKPEEEDENEEKK